MKLSKLSRSRSGSAPPSPASSPRIASPSNPVAPKGRPDRGRSGSFCVPLPRSRSRPLDADSSEIAESPTINDFSSTPLASPPGVLSSATLNRRNEPSFRDVPPTVLQEIKQVFSHFDSNKDGKISAEELRSVLRCLGDSITDKEAERMVQEVDSDGDGFIDLPEFVDLNTKGLRLTGELASVDELTDAFEIFDLDKDGQITAEELQSVLTSLGGEQCTVEDCQKMIRGVDRKGSGHVDFDDFKLMMTSSSLQFGNLKS